ncbi:hypothetical protein [Streptomyces phytohabitans]|uniref:hypothetical protein n=1 Tax=Streptomyces phytohabitans TaxID=1150371 RepID=UPI00387ECD68
MEIRVICERPNEAETLKALSTVFDLGPVRRHPARERNRVRLYTTAERTDGAAERPVRRSTAVRVPVEPGPEEAYANAPGIVSEIAWVGDRTASRAAGEPVGREFWLRKAATLDRIALHDVDNYPPDVAAKAVDVAERAAALLAEFDHRHYTTRGALWPLVQAAGVSYRPYVRQEYLAWKRAGS